MFAVADRRTKLAHAVVNGSTSALGEASAQPQRSVGVIEDLFHVTQVLVIKVGCPLMDSDSLVSVESAGT